MMAVIACTEKEVFERIKSIKKLLSPLVHDKNHIDVKSIAGRLYTLTVVARGFPASSIGSPDQLRIKTKINGIYFNYYESWTLQDKKNLMNLERSYLHLYKKPSVNAEDRQVLCLHCDPLIKNSNISFNYKRNPHIHLMGASPNIDRAHISMCLGHSVAVCENIDSLTSVLDAAINLISKEIFPSYERNY